MPSYLLLLGAEVENIACILPIPGRRWGLKLQCGRCNEVAQKFMYVDPTETVETTGGGKANAMSSCKFCKNQMSVTIQDDGVRRGSDGSPSPVMAFDVRGAEPVGVDLEDAWEAVAAESETRFSQVDLSTDWCDYDEKGGAAVSIMSVSCDFARAK